MFKLPCQDEEYVLKIIEVTKQEETKRGRPFEHGWGKARRGYPRPWLKGVYTDGNCGSLYTHLKSVFNCAKAVKEDWGDTHVITKIGSSFYDVRGKQADYYYDPRYPGHQVTEEELEDLSFNYGDRCWNPYAENPRPTPQQIRRKLMQLKATEQRYMAKTQRAIKKHIQTDEFSKLK